MISKSRLKIDTLIQGVLAGLAVLGLFFTSWKLAAIGLILLGIWQTGSALELYLDYQYKNRRNYLLVLPVPLLGFAAGAQWGFLLLAFFGLVYAGQTVRDYVIVRRRPRSFWEL